MRGFIISIITLSFVTLLYLLSISMHNHFLSVDRALAAPQSLSYGSFIFDNVAYGLQQLVGPNLTLSEANTSTSVMISDTVPGTNVSDKLSTYSDYLSNSFANSNHAAIAANFTNLTGGQMKLWIMNDYVYLNNITNSTMTFIRPGGTNASSYIINISVSKYRTGLSPFQFNPNGDMNVLLTYTDFNATEVEQGKLFSNSPNLFQVTYANGSYADVYVGMVSNSAGSIEILTSNDTPAAFTWQAVLPPLSNSEYLGFYYDATMSYAQGNAMIARRIGK